jgi:hypothetical protein
MSPSSSYVPFPSDMDHRKPILRRSSKDIPRAQQATIAHSYPPSGTSQSPWRTRRYSDQLGAHPRPRHLQPAEPFGALRPSQSRGGHSDKSSSSRLSHRREHRHHIVFRADDLPRSDTSSSGFTSPSEDFTLLSSVSSQSGPREDWKYTRRWQCLDPYLPVGAKPHDSQAYVVKSHPPPPQQRRRSVSLLNCLMRGGMALFDINPRWAKRPPLL